MNVLGIGTVIDYQRQKTVTELFQLIALLLINYKSMVYRNKGLRYTHVTTLIDTGITSKTIADRLGNTVKMIYNLLV